MTQRWISGSVDDESIDSMVVQCPVPLHLYVSTSCGWSLSDWLFSRLGGGPVAAYKTIAEAYGKGWPMDSLKYRYPSTPSRWPPLTQPYSRIWDVRPLTAVFHPLSHTTPYASAHKTLLAGPYGKGYPAMPDPSSPSGGPPPKRPPGRFGGGLPARRPVFGRLLPPWIPHSVRP
jgi:hypothetical protein